MSIKRNFAYSGFLTMAGYVFPLITYPYVSRVLGVTNIGKCNFIDNIIQCFVLISMLGIATVGIREIAKNKEDKVALSKVFTGLFIINSFTTLLALCFLFISIHSIEKFAGYKELLFIGSFKLFGTYFIIRKSKFPQNPKRSVRFSGKGTKRSVQKRKARNTQKAETKVL